MKRYSSLLTRLGLALLASAAATYVWAGFTYETEYASGGRWISAADKDTGSTQAELTVGSPLTVSIRKCGNHRSNGWQHTHIDGTYSVVVASDTWSHADYSLGWSKVYILGAEYAVAEVSD